MEFANLGDLHLKLNELHKANQPVNFDTFSCVGCRITNEWFTSQMERQFVRYRATCVVYFLSQG